MRIRSWRGVRSTGIVTFATALLLGISTALATSYVATDLYTVAGPPNGLTLPGGPQFAHAGQVVGTTTAFGGTQALLWSGSSSFTNLNPSGFSESNARAVRDGQQVGFGRVDGSIRSHALLWSGSAASAVDLTPADFDEAVAEGVDAGKQVGYGHREGDANHALMWSGTAASVIDLHPATGFVRTFGRATDGVQQVGSGFAQLGGGPSQALLWSGSAASMVNLGPAGLSSNARGVRDGVQVGSATGSATGNQQHAVLWLGSAESMVDLHPVGFDRSEAFDTANGLQVGEGVPVGGDRHALVWSGTASSFVDLHLLLEPGFAYSMAATIDDAGNVYGIARTDDGVYHAIRWSPVPEPSSTSVILLALGRMLIARRRRD
jgi:hypothetical protein